MSQSHFEGQDRHRGITVRVKMVNLNPVVARAGQAERQTPAEGCLGAMAGHTTEKGRRRASEAGMAAVADGRYEVCIQSQRRIPNAEFENHIEHCEACSNRVELQLDFMDTLEAAVFHRHNQPNAQRFHGALLVSAPALNFAVCGEIEVGKAL
jgi:hypothetical protein